MRSDFILSCCSTADLPLSYFEERDIHFTCFHFQMGGKEYLDDLGQSIPFDEFYRRIADGAQPTPRRSMSSSMWNTSSHF